MPEVSRPAEKNMPNSPASSASGSGCPVAGSRRRSRCAAMLTSSAPGSPLAFTCAKAWLHLVAPSKAVAAQMLEACCQEVRSSGKSFSQSLLVAQQ